MTHNFSRWWVLATQENGGSIDDGLGPMAHKLEDNGDLGDRLIG